MGLFNRSTATTEARTAYRTANKAQQDYARTSRNRDENDPTYLKLNDTTNQALRGLKAAKKAR